jgi:Dolichyl-phosphate-mannose-protein mannosyltransferase
LLAAIATAAFVVRVVYMFAVAGPIGAVGDSSYYYYASNLMAQGRGYSEPFTLMFHGQLVPTALHPPLWPAVLAVVSLFTAPGTGVGHLGGLALDLHRVLGCAVGAVVVVLVGLLGRRIGGWRVGLVAAALAALYPRFIVLDAVLSSEGPFSAIVCVMLLMAYRFAERPTRARALGLGALVGLAALTREEALLFVPIFLVPVAWRAGPSRLQFASLAVLGTLVVILPWTVRNYVDFHEFVPVANSGAVVGGANCPLTYYGSEIGSWQPACLHDAHPSPNEAVESARQQSLGVNYALKHPARAVLVAGIRLLRVWSLFAPNVQTIGNISVLWVGTVIYYCLLVAAAYGLVLLRRRGRSIMILIAPAIVVSVASVLGDGLERLRYDAELPMLALAAWTIVFGFGKATRHRTEIAHALRTISQ